MKETTKEEIIRDLEEKIRILDNKSYGLIQENSHLQTQAGKWQEVAVNLSRYLDRLK